MPNSSPPPPAEVALDHLFSLIRDPYHAARVPQSDWDNVLRLARSANLLSRIANEIQASGSESAIPMKVKPHLLSARRVAGHQAIGVQWEIRELYAALRNSPAPVVLLKGSAYAARGLRAARGRLFGDVDIMVPRAQIPPVEANLMLNGWRCDPVGAYDERYYREWMHELPPMVNHRRGTVLDLHHTILPPTAKASPPAELLFQAAEPLADLPGFFTLAPTDMVIHSATHLTYESELRNGLRDLVDIRELVSQFALEVPDFWNQLVRRANALGLSRPTALALSLSRELVCAEVPATALQSLWQSGRSSQHLVWMFRWACRPHHHLLNDGHTAVARSLVYIRGHYLRMPLRLLVPHLVRKAVMRLGRSDSRSL